MSHDGAAAAARDSSSSNRLSPPSFQLPENMQDYEVWTVRLPASINVDSLQGVELDVSESATFETQNDEQLKMTRGQAFENEQFRLLIPSDDFLVPHNRPFDRHYNITVNHGHVAEVQLAPRLELAPEPTDTFRQSYSHIPQVAGFKRRWMPPGGGSVANKQMKCQERNNEESAAAAPTSVKSELHSITSSVASSTDTPRSSNRTPKQVPYMNGDHVSSKKKAKKHKKEKKKTKEKKKRRSGSSKVKSEDG